MNNRFRPLTIAVSVVIGIIIGTFFENRFSGNRLNIINSSSNKLNDLLHMVNDQYVDTVNIADVVEASMPKIMQELDPHSKYFPASEVQALNDDLRGSFSGVGVQFVIRKDTVRINSVIKGGPSEKVGILAGDKLISVNDSPFVGKIVTNEEVMRRLKGEKGSSVKLGILRRGSKKPLSFTVVRGDVPVKSVDATYMLNDKLGYVRIKSFGETTYAELLTSLAELEQEDFKGLVIDIRSNGGGYLNSVIQIANEFLPKNRLIVYTEGRKSKREEFKSDGRGTYQDIPLIILTDEISASASEILSGAIQDNDRGVIVGRRTFGKGLVQQPFEFADGSMIRLTVARYYTPSGRCIQKPYKKGDDMDEYENEILVRYQHGEFFNEDSIRQSGEVYHTSIGREVYGGGGIMPDYFVAEDTTLFTPYYNEAVSSGIISQFCFDYIDANRSELQRFTKSEELVKHLRKHNVVEKFIRYADQNKLRRRNNMILKSQKLIEQAVYATMIYDVLDMEYYVRYMNHSDPTVLKAIQLFNDRRTVPTINTNDKKRAKK